MKTVNAGTLGVSGALSFTSGTTSRGASGSITLATGTATSGKGGNIVLSVSPGTAGIDPTDTGGDVIVRAGDSTAASGTGSGGAISLTTGLGTERSSGDFVVHTSNAGSSGVSGKLSFTSGTSSAGNSGLISMVTGAATNGKAGSFEASVQIGKTGDGGDIVMTAGETCDDARGGAISMTAGKGNGAAGGNGAFVRLIGGVGTSSSGGAVSISSGKGGNWRRRVPHLKTSTRAARCARSAGATPTCCWSKSSRLARTPRSCPSNPRSSRVMRWTSGPVERVAN